MIEDALPDAERLCRRFEGLRVRPYLCPAGVPSIGYGATRYENGHAVTLVDPEITPERALLLLRWQLRTQFLPGVLKCCPELDTPGRLAAVGDFAFNLGLGALYASTLRKRIRADRWEDVPDQLRRWVNGGGRRLPGLIARREAEIALL